MIKHPGRNISLFSMSIFLQLATKRLTNFAVYTLIDDNVLPKKRVPFVKNVKSLGLLGIVFGGCSSTIVDLYLF
jgi:hypothetical protein